MSYTIDVNFISGGDMAGNEYPWSGEAIVQQCWIEEVRADPTNPLNLKGRCAHTLRAAGLVPVRDGEGGVKWVPAETVVETQAEIDFRERERAKNEAYYETLVT